MQPLKQKCNDEMRKITPLQRKAWRKCDPFARNKLWAHRKSARVAFSGTPWSPVLKPLSLCYNQAYPPVAHKLECAYLWPCLILTLHLPGDLLFARPKGALRLSARLIPNRKRRAFGAIVLSRINGPEHSSYPLPPPRPPPPSPPILFLLQFSSSSISRIPPVLLLLQSFSFSSPPPPPPLLPPPPPPPPPTTPPTTNSNKH